MPILAAHAPSPQTGRSRLQEFKQADAQADVQQASLRARRTRTVKIHVATWHHLRLAISGPAVSPSFRHCGALPDFRRQPPPPEITAQGDATDRAAPLHGVHFTPMAADVVSACGQSVHPQLGAFKMLLMGDLLDAKRDGLKWSVSA